MPVTLICEACNKEFKVPPARAEKAKCCSMDCVKLRTEQRMPLAECKSCGTEFKTTHDRKIYCKQGCKETKKTIECKFCGISFKSKINTETGKYSSHCSLECRKKAANIILCCAVCGKEYPGKRYELKRNRKYCSKECRSKAVIAHVNSTRNQTGSYVSSNNVVIIKTDEGYRLEHRVLVEKAIGRSLNYWDEPILHINGNTADNKLSNLFICDNKSHCSHIINSYEYPYPISSNITEKSIKQT